MWVAADTGAGDLATALIPAVWTFLGIVVVTLGTIYVQGRRDRSEERRATSQPAPAVNGNGNGTTHLMSVARDMGALVQRADDNDDRDDLQDRRHERHDERIEALERYHDRRDPGWRDR